ncbi:MAG: hypothetical protein ACI9CE_003926 [Flavobacterium sp.]|jgi:hypothetical protein
MAERPFKAMKIVDNKVKMYRILEAVRYKNENELYPLIPFALKELKDVPYIGPLISWPKRFNFGY